MVNGTDTYYYRFNLQGDVTGIFDSNGSLVAEYTYDAWGKLLSVGGSNTTIANLNPIRYRGYYYDTESGFYYLQSRYYDPEVCRFISPDAYISTGQGVLGHNMYAYSLNNPVNFYDPSGAKCICLTRRVGPRHVCESVLAAQKKESLRDVTEEVNAVLIPMSQSAEDLRQTANASPMYIRTTYEAIIYFEFYQLVDHEAPLDIKVEKSWKNTIGTPFPGFDEKILYNGTITTVEMLGNYIYGYIGYSYGIPLPVLYAGSYYAAGFPTLYKNPAETFDEVLDWNDISHGYSDAQRRKK